MGKITHKSKKASPQHPQITELVANILATSSENLPKFLYSIDTWKWPRSDLNAWVKVLDKFDAILDEEIIRAYDIDNLQSQPFSPQAKALASEILRFERLLLENSTNRKMFNSYDRLNSLLFTSDLDILVLTLFLLLRPSQQYSSQNFVIESLGLSTSRLESLLKPWLGVREHGIDLLELVSEDESHKITKLPPDASEVNYSFYRRPVVQNGENKDSKMDIEETPNTQAQNTQSGPVAIHIGPLAGSSRGVMEILAETVENYSVPTEHKYELMCRIRTAWSLGKDRLEDRRKLVIIRLLSIAIWVHTHNDGRSQSSVPLNSLFVYEPDLAMHIAELLQLERGVPSFVQTAAITALDGLVRIRSRIQEVLGVVNAGVNHGIMMSLLRKTVLEVSNAQADVPQLFVDALLSFVIYIASHAAGGNMLVGAGLIPLLVQLIENKHPQRLNVVSKALQLFDNALYGYANAFQVFCHSHGVEALTDRIQFEVDYAINEFASTGKKYSLPAGAYGSLSVVRTGLLKHILRSMHRMMQSSGTTEGLRGLIDSSLLKSVKKIIEFRGLFGPSIFPIAINIMATFVHNEPTSLTIIQESGLPELFYQTIEIGVETSIECIQAVLNAIGALCLNQSGQDQLAARPSIIPTLMSIFTSEKHLKVLQEKENATSIGGSLDELIRHHPALKTPVFESLDAVLAVIEELGNRFTPSNDICHWYMITSSSSSSLSKGEDAVMDDSLISSVAPATSDLQQSEVGGEDQASFEEEATKPPENIVVSYMNAICKCLEGLFQNATHCKDFINSSNGLKRLMRLMTLPCLPYDFPDQSRSNGDFLVHVLQVMTEVAPSEVVTYMAMQIKQTFNLANDLWQSGLGESRFLRILDLSDEELLSEANNDFRKVVTLYIQICVFQHVCEGYHSRSRGPSSLFAILTGSNCPAVLSDLATVHRTCIWENILLKAGLNAKGINLPVDAEASSSAGSFETNPIFGTERNVDNLLSMLTRHQTISRKESNVNGSSRERTAVAFKHLLTEIPKTLSVFFRGLARLFTFSRRSVDTMQKKPTLLMASTFASMILNHIEVELQSEDKLSLYTYYTCMLSILNDFLFDERGNLYVLVCFHFRYLRGFDAVLKVCRRYTDAVSRITNDGKETAAQSNDDNQELIYVYGGLRVALQLLHQLVSYKPSADSALSVQLLSSGKSETAPDYYEPHDFLVKIRLSVFPFITDLWRSSWLVVTPPNVNTYVVQSLLEMMAGDNEESRGGTNPEPGPSSVPALIRSSRPDEDRIRQLTDMGFPRSSVVRALTRSNNNVTVATEFLLATPFPLIAEVEAEAENPGDGHEDVFEEASETPAAEDNSDMNILPTANGNLIEEGTVAERRAQLNLARDNIKVDLGSVALKLLDAHQSLIFVVRQAFIGASDSFQAQAIGVLVEDIRKFSPSAHDVHEEPLAIRCRLLALVLLESPFSVFQSTAGTEQELMDSLLALLLSSPTELEKEQATPKWLAALLLVVEALMAQSERPRAINLPLPTEPIKEESVYTGPSYTESRNIVFDYCLRLLQISTLPYDDFLAVLRVLVQLTRDPKVSQELIRRRGLSSLFQHHKLLPADAKITGGPLYLSIILRHLVEDQTTLKLIMQQNIKRLLSHPRTRVMEMTNFVRSCGQMATRDVHVFLDATKSLCYLLQPDTPNNNISLKQSAEENVSNSLEIESMNKDQILPNDFLPTSNNQEELESVIHFIIGELLRVGKIVSDASTAKTASDSLDELMKLKASSSKLSPSLAHEDTPSTKDSSADNFDFSYMCLLLQCLAELLSSYDSCKSAFLSYSKKRGQTPNKEGGSKHKTTALNFLLLDLITFGAFAVGPTANTQKKVALCKLAISVVVALCIDSPTSDAKNNPVDLSVIRKVVLEAISRSIKEAPVNEPVDARYGRLLALTDLCNSLLTVKFNASKPHDETSIKIAKIMLEKNYVATLTNILSDVDLAYPNMLKFFDTILRPLEQLTKIAIKMGRAMDKVKDIPDKESDSRSSVDSDAVDEIVNGEREETPDLYRNSSLGMFTGEMEDTNYGPDDEMEQDDEDEDIDMEYEDTASDDSSNTDEEAVHDGMLDVAVNESGQTWQDVDEEMDEDNPSDEDESDEEEDAEGDEDEEILWQDVTDPDGIVPDGLADDVEDDEGIEIPIIEEHDDDDADMLSEEDVAEDLETLEGHEHRYRAGDDPFGLGRQILRGIGLRDERILFSGTLSNGRGRLESGPGMHIFSRSRPLTTSGPDPTTHPLLLENINSTSSTIIPSRGHMRRLHRGIFSAGSVTDLMQTIDDFIGGGAMDLLQQALSSGPMGGDIHVQIPAFGEHGQIHRGGRLPLPPAMRVESHVSDGIGQRLDFSPFSTSERWMEESRMIHTKHLNERLNFLSNHVTLALLPEARKVAEKSREKAEKEKADREAAIRTSTPNVEHTTRPVEEIQPEQDVAADLIADLSYGDAGNPTDIIPRDDAEVSISQAVISEIQDTDMADMTVSATVDPPHREDVADGPVANLSRVDETLLAPVENTSGSPSNTQHERVTVTIHGNAVDITDTGIDPTFLEALPDEMREEIINQHFREQRVAQVEQPTESQISPEFLDALPPEIREEILQQERMERSRRELSQNVERARTGTTTGPLEIDPASFIASLDPQLRQVVLLDQDDVFLQTLPSHMIAEAGVYRDGSNAEQDVRREIPAPTSSQTSRKPLPSKDAIQLLDRSGIAALVRLLFFPQLPRKNALHKILLNLCENAKSRTDLFSLLLNILQDGTGDLVAVDRTFAQMSVRTPKSPAQSTPKGAGKQKNALGYAATPGFQFAGEVPSDMIAQRSLDALSYIVGTNELSSLFFLTEHELPAAMKRSTSKKGKGKEKQTAAQSYYPIVLLLGLLDRPSLLKTPSIMDSLAGLLAAVTRPLTSLLQENKQKTDGPVVVDSSLAERALESHNPSSSGTHVTQDVETSTAAASTSGIVPANGVSVESLEEKILLTNPPQIPHPTLRLIVNILTIGECSGRTFQHTLALIQHLFCVHDAREIIAQELRVKAQEFGQSLCRDLDMLTNALRSEFLQEDLPSSAAAKFSPASSDQAKFLRVLKTIDYMYSAKSTKHSSDGTEKGDQNTVHEIYESFHFTLLWRKLGECLSVIEEKSDVEHVATILLPLIESLMVVCKYVGSKQAANSAKTIVIPSSPRPSISSKEDLFVQFTDTHRKILNLMVRNNPSLMSGSFSLLVNNSRVLDFDNKRNYFNQQLHRRTHPREHYGTLQLNIRRARVFEDSYQYLQRKTGEQIKYGKLSVRFYDEEGVDAGGVTREWFQILARQMFNPNYALFEPCAADKQTYQPNRASAVNNEHLSFFKFVGRVIGKAIYDGRLLDAYFARSLYRQLLGKPVDYRDVEWVDPEYYNSLCWILENDPSPLDLTFIAEVDEFGKRDIIPLKEGGAQILVNQENKKEYVQLSAQYRLYSSIKDQIESLLAGFYEVIPKDLISIFNEQEVELLISGTPDIDVDEWRAATEYNGYTSSDPVIVWWWRALKSFNRDERAKVLSFATGTSRVPLGGFVELQGVQGIQRFSIHRAYGDPDRLPQAHTCFNQIDLPQYTSYEMLRQQLLLAINEGGEGFGFA